MKKTIVTLATVLALGGFAACEVPEEGTDASNGGGKDKSTSKTEGKGNKAEKPKPEMTTSQANALRAAENYLDLMAFSKKGLIQQLSSKAGDGYSKADATFAANNVDADWKAEAVEAAEQYQEIMPMSRDGLMDQLTSAAGDQYTQEQAAYAVKKVGL